MSCFPVGNMDKLSYCLTCGGTGRRGGNLGSRKKKVCHTCHGTGGRTIEAPRNATVVDSLTSVTIPACFYPRIGCFTEEDKENKNGIHE